MIIKIRWKKKKRLDGRNEAFSAMGWLKYQCSEGDLAVLDSFFFSFQCYS